MQQNGIYNIPLPRGPGPNNQKQKGTERGINYKISTRDGSGIDLDLTYNFFGISIALRTVCSFRKTKQK
jgi:hypothetical protein